jgi:hypothetical protein
MVTWLLAVLFSILIVAMLVAAHRRWRANRALLLRATRSTREQIDQLVGLARQVEQLQQVVQEGVERLAASRGQPGSRPDSENSELQESDGQTAPRPSPSMPTDPAEALPTSRAAVVDARTEWLRQLHASSAAFIERAERGDEGASWWKTPQPKSYPRLQLEAIRLLASQQHLNWSDAERCLQRTRTYLRPQRPISNLDIWIFSAALHELPHEPAWQDPASSPTSQHGSSVHRIREKSARLGNLLWRPEVTPAEQ